jgi:hypothetical protein
MIMAKIQITQKMIKKKFLSHFKSIVIPAKAGAQELKF